MIPILYESNETKFTSNGLGRLWDCTSCEVTEVRNGEYEIEFEYPVNGSHFNDILISRIIGATHDEKGDIQPFDIYYHSKPMYGRVTFRGHHISYRQRGITAKPGRTTLNNAFDTLKRTSTPDNPFNYFADVVLSSSEIVPAFTDVPMTVRELLGGVEGSILDTIGGEFEWDKFNVNLWRARGINRDFTIRYGVNMAEFNEEMDISESYNAVRGYWSNNDELQVGSMVTLGTMPAGRTFCIPLDVSDKFETKPTVAQVDAAVRSYMSSNQTYLPKQTIQIDFVRLQESDEYKRFADLFTCNLCDTVRVIFPMYGIEGRFKIVKTVWNVLLDRYNEMELGSPSTTLSEALGLSSSGGSSGSGGTSGPKIKTGTITGNSISGNRTADYTVTFDEAFSSPPVVVACFQSTSTAGYFGRCTIGIVSTTATQCVIRVFNGDSSSRGPNINWIAVGA